MENDLKLARKSNLISGLPAGVADAVCRESVRHSYSRGSNIFLQGDPARTLYIVLEGWVKLYRISQSGEEAVVAVFTQGQSFGEAVVLRQGSFPVSAEAATDCRLMHINASVLFELMRQHPEVVGSIMASMYGHFQELVQQIEHLKARTGAQRVAEFLLDLCGDHKGRMVVRLPYDKILIAGRLGLKPESLSRSFAKLKDAGVTVMQNEAVITDVARLRDYAEEDRALAWARAH